MAVDIPAAVAEAVAVAAGAGRTTRAWSRTLRSRGWRATARSRSSSTGRPTPPSAHRTSRRRGPSVASLSSQPGPASLHRSGDGRLCRPRIRTRQGDSALGRVAGCPPTEPRRRGCMLGHRETTSPRSCRPRSPPWKSLLWRTHSPRPPRRQLRRNCSSLRCNLRLRLRIRLKVRRNCSKLRCSLWLKLRCNLRLKLRLRLWLKLRRSLPRRWRRPRRSSIRSPCRWRRHSHRPLRSWWRSSSRWASARSTAERRCVRPTATCKLPRTFCSSCRRQGQK